jgi:hypothetical protein
MKTIRAAVLLALLVTIPPLRAADEKIDWEKARQLLQRERKGESLTADEQTYLDRAKAERNKPRNQPVGNAPAAKESTGLIPLTDLTETYKDQTGGLYGDKKNEPPADHLKRAMAASSKIQPLDAAGKPKPDGKIALVSIGMSNTTQEFSRFKKIADSSAEKNPNLVLVDGAQGGRDAPAWVEGRGNIKAEAVWSVVDDRLKAANVSREQVQIVWIKQAIAGPANRGDFPKHADALTDDLAVIITRAKERFPNLQIAYVSSRIYAGYATGQLNPEPYAYEGAFSVQRLIAKQVKGDAALNCDAAKGAVKAPVILWGPYLWADGTKGRKQDKLVWNRDDFANDGTHPSESGREKVAQVLSDFFKTDATSKPWYLKPAK